MTTFRTVLQAGLLLAVGYTLSGCDKLQEIGQLKSDTAANKQQTALLQAEITAINTRLNVLESVPKKATSNDGPAPLSPEQLAALEPVIAQCVKIARTSSPKGEEAFYVGFDAYYNPGTGRVINNVRLQGEVPALYVFNKCMTSKGFPLT